MTGQWIDKNDSSWASDMRSHAETFVEIYKVGDTGFWQDEYDESVVSNVHDMFERFASGELAETERIRKEVDEAKTCLEKDLNECFNGIDMRLEGWSGAAAEQFRAEYLPATQDAIGLLIEALTNVDYVLRAYDDMRHALKNEVNNLVEKTHAALDEERAEDVDRGKQIALTLVTAVATIGAAVATGGGSLAIATALGATNALASIGTLIVTGSSERQVITDMVEKGQIILDEAEESNRRISKAFYEVTKSLTGTNLPEVRPDRPALITDDHFSPDRFKHDDQPKRISDNVNREDVVAEPTPDRDEAHDHNIKRPSPFFIPRPAEDVYEEQ